MMMVSDEWVECRIDDDDEDDGGEEQMNAPPPPPEFASKAPTPASAPTPPTASAPTPPTAPATPTPTPTPTPTHPVNRDPYGINRHLKVEVSDVLAEPASPHSIDRVWVTSLVGFEATRVWTYKCLSLLCAVPLALLAGILLALLACLHVWFVVPCIQLCQTFLPCLRSLWMCAVNILITPFCSSFALCCSQIAISLSNKDSPLMSGKESV